MTSILEHCTSLPVRTIDAGGVLITEGGLSDQLFVLRKGTLEVHRNNDTIAMATEPGAVFGEMSVLLQIPHTASVRAVHKSEVYEASNARVFLEENPEFLLPIAQLLASRLRNSTTYLVDLKRQFRDHSDHFAMVDQVLESMAYDQNQSFTPDEQLPADP